jgi:hypothetical protein
MGDCDIGPIHLRGFVFCRIHVPHAQRRGADLSSKSQQTESDRCAVQDSRSCDLPLGVLGSGNDLLGSWIENEVLARHE